MPSSTKQRRLDPCRYGSILLLVLVAIIIMALTTTSYLLLMRNEYRATYYRGNHLQTELLAQSGVEYLRAFLDQSRADIELQGGLVDSPDSMQDILVLDDSTANSRGRFTVVAPGTNLGYYSGLRFGLESESAKLNLNSLLATGEITLSTGETVDARSRLLAIPGMSETAADSILDWIDEDDTPRSYGAESAYYQGLSPAYLPRNGPLAHLDELLMIQGVTIEMLYGVDVNRNYLVDDEEMPQGELASADNTDGQLDRGWSAYLTLQSLEKNVTSDGESKINLNDSDLETLHGELQQVLGVAEANFIIAYRQFGPADENTNDATESSDSVEIDFDKEAQATIDSLLDLINARVSMTSEDDSEGGAGNSGRSGRSGRSRSSSGGANNSASQILESPWQDDPSTYRLDFAKLQDFVTVDTDERVAGRININEATLPVLLTIPGMPPPVADQILSQRDPAVDLINGDQRHPTWPLADGLLTLEEFKPMLPFLTTRGDVFSGQIVGYFEAGTARARISVLLDRSGKKTELIDWQDLSRLGPGFSRAAISNLVTPEE